MRVTLAQLDPIVGDVTGNARMLRDAMDRARADGAELLVGAELGLIGYPPRDLLFRAGVVEACEDAVADLAADAGRLGLVVGHPRRGPTASGRFRNSASVCSGGRVSAVYDKRLLPGYDVFDEDRYFESGQRPLVFEAGAARVGLLICEDLWRAEDAQTQRRYPADPVAETVAAGCDLLVALNANPFVMGKWRRQLEQLQIIARRHRVPIIAVHTAGANDDLIFDGRSVVVGADGSVVRALPGWTAAVETVDVPQGGGSAADGGGRLEYDPMEEVFRSLSLGVADYCRKTGNERVLLGLSGGIDSAVTACIATAALGADSVMGVLMPSRYSSVESLEDARALERNLDLRPGPEVPIESIHRAVQETLEAASDGRCEAVTDENVQSRVRGTLIMALSNAMGGLVLATGNKSELATGYCTIYGDVVGALSVLGDVVKTRIYELARWINANHQALGFDTPPIPRPSLSKPPSAELRPNQTDQDTLPPYEVLDAIVERYIEREQSPEQIIEETGCAPDLVRDAAAMIDRAQYKRDQAPLVLKITPRTFGRGRPMPIAMRWSSRGSLLPHEVQQPQ